MKSSIPSLTTPHQRIWNRYDVESWPTLVLIDPEGYLLFKNGGEVKADLFDNAIMKKLVPYYRKKGLLDEKPLALRSRTLSRHANCRCGFPSKIAADEAGNRLFISDSNHNRIVVARLDGQLLDVIGSGETGKADGDFKTAQFNRPQGMAIGRRDALRGRHGEPSAPQDRLETKAGCDDRRDRKAGGKWLARLEPRRPIAVRNWR